MLSYCPALCCVFILGAGPWAFSLSSELCVLPTIPYIMLWLYKMGLSVDLCVLLCTLLAFYIVFFLWVGGVEPFKLNIKSLPCVFLAETQFQRLVLRPNYGSLVLVLVI